MAVEITVIVKQNGKEQKYLMSKHSKTDNYLKVSPADDCKGVAPFSKIYLPLSDKAKTGKKAKRK